MGIQLDPLSAFLLAGGLLALAFFVFARVRSDYRTSGHLTRPAAVLQTGFFFVYAFSSYLFLDSRLTAVSATDGLLVLALVLMIAGLSIVLSSMPFLGKRSFGREIGQLHTSGIYQYSRNPQVTGSFVFIIGYILLWPSWTGLIWAVLWLPISWLMVRGEEEHLSKVFGKEYEQYCGRTPRYIGIPGKR